MENGEDFSTQKTINDLIKRAEDEREKAINTIEFLQMHKVPETFSNAQAVVNNLTEIATRLDIDFQGNNDDIEKLRNSCIFTLNTLKEQLQNVQLTEEELLNSDVIGNSYRMLEEISKKLDIIPTKIWEKNKETILNSISEKEKVEKEQKTVEALKDKKEKEKVELEKEEMYLKGKLEVTILRKNKKRLEEEISKVRAKIQKLDNELMNIHLSENNKRNGELDEKDEELDEKSENTDNETIEF